MPKSSRTLYNGFLTKATSLEVVRTNFESALTAGTITQNDILQAYSGLFFDLFTSFEGAIEELFLGILNGDIRHAQSTVSRLLRISPKSQVENALLRGEDYLKWLPYSITRKRADIYFSGGRPFDNITQVNINILQNYQAIRNAIAHKSKSALNKFNNLIATLVLLPHERTPSGYLRSIPNPAAGQTQLQIISTTLLNILHNLCH
jgi:hypothetical protein